MTVMMFNIKARGIISGEPIEKRCSAAFTEPISFSRSTRRYNSAGGLNSCALNFDHRITHPRQAFSHSMQRFPISINP